MSIFRRIPPTLAALAVLLGIAQPAAAGDGRFTEGPLDLSVSNVSAVASGDFNNDGRPDLATAAGINGTVVITLQRQDGTLAPGGTVQASLNDAQLIAVADFNRDGRDDIAVGDTSGTGVAIRLGSIGGGFEDAPSIDLGRPARSLVVGDFNGDGFEDLAAATNKQNEPRRIAVATGDGQGRFGAVKTGQDGAGVLAVGDFDSDAVEDLAVGGHSPASNGNVFIGSGGGGFGSPTTIPLPQSATYQRGWAVADFNGDSKPDIVAAQGNDLTSVRLGDGKGKLDTGPNVLTRGKPGAVAVGDFNSDDNEDFVVTDMGGGGNARIRLGDGKGGFTPAPDVPAGAKQVDVAVADFNSDGNDDLAIADAQSNTVKIRIGSGRAPQQGNLLKNGGFEGPTPTGKIQPQTTITGWQLEGGISHARYGTAPHGLFPNRIAAPRYGTGGGRMLAGGYSMPTNGVTAAAQTVDVANNAAAIDAGRARANLSAYLGGALKFEDSMRARAEFLNGEGATIGSFEIGPVTAADRNNQTTMLRRADSRAVPAGTRGIRVRMVSNDPDKTYSSAIADNAKLTLDVAAAPPLDREPPRGQEPLTFGGQTLVTLTPAARKIRAGKPLKVRVRNRNDFGVTGRLTAAGRARSLAVSGRSTQTLKVRLSAKQRRALKRKRSLSVRLTAVVRDPAGQTRRVSRRVRVRLKSK